MFKLLSFRMFLARTMLAVGVAALLAADEGASSAYAQDKPRPRKPEPQKPEPEVPDPAQSEPAAEAEKKNYPKAETLLDTYVEVTGGKKAHEKLKTRTSSGTFSVETLGIKGKIQTWQKAPDRMRSIVEMGELGRSESGVEKGVAWELSPLTGARIVDGAQAAFMLREATFNADLNWRKICESVETVGEVEVAGKPAWKVSAKTKDGATMYLYYDQYSNLLVRIDAEVATSLGQVNVEVYPADYRKVSGILVPFKSTQKMMGVTQTAEFDSIVFNQNIPDDRFALPKEVSGLIANRRTKDVDSPARKPAPRRERP